MYLLSPYLLAPDSFTRTAQMLSSRISPLCLVDAFWRVSPVSTAIFLWFCQCFPCWWIFRSQAKGTFQRRCLLSFLCPLASQWQWLQPHSPWASVIISCITLNFSMACTFFCLDLSNFRGQVSYILYHVLRASQKFARYDCLHAHLFVFRGDAWTHHFPRIYPALHVIHLVMSAIGQILTILTRNIDGGSGQDGEMVWQRGLWMAENRVQYQWTASSNIYKRESQRTNLAKFENSWIEGWSFQSHVWRSEDNHPGNTEIAEIFRLDLAFNRRPLCDVLDSTFCDCATECCMHAVLTTDCFCVCIKCSFKFSMPTP